MERASRARLGTPATARGCGAGWGAAGRAAAFVLCLGALLAPAAACRKKPAGSGGAGLTAEQYYAQGMRHLDRHHFQRARRMFERAMSQPDVSRELVADASLGMADAYFRDGGIINVAEALSRYTSFLTFYPTHPSADYAQYQLARSYLKQALGPDKDQSTTHKALEEFRKVWREHPDSEWADRAREMADECRERLAESEMRVGLFYKRGEAYTGAIARFRTILEEYPRYSRRDRVYFELAESLRASRKTDEALIYFQKLVEEYPESRYVSQAHEFLERSEAASGRTAEASDEERSAKREEHREPARSEGR